MVENELLQLLFFADPSKDERWFRQKLAQLNEEAGVSGIESVLDDVLNDWAGKRVVLSPNVKPQSQQECSFVMNNLG